MFSSVEFVYYVSIIFRVAILLVVLVFIYSAANMIIKKEKQKKLRMQLKEHEERKEN